MDHYYSELTTETINARTQDIDSCSTADILKLMNEQDQTVPAAVGLEIPNIAKAVDALHAALQKGGRMFYVGAGTSGRLGVLDASECPPTFGTPAELVQGHIAGGDRALREAIEGCEDDGEAGKELMKSLAVTKKDVVIGITASGSAAYVIGAVKEAKARGAGTIAIVNNKGSRLESECDICIAPVVGPEVIMGSTRLKSGTAQKLVLNMLSTAVMIKLGKVYNNLMVDLKATNKKLTDRAVRIVCAATGAGEEEALSALNQAGMQAKTAILMLLTGVTPDCAAELLQSSGGFLKEAVKGAGTYGSSGKDTEGVL